MSLRAASAPLARKHALQMRFQMPGPVRLTSRNSALKNALPLFVESTLSGTQACHRLANRGMTMTFCAVDSQLLHEVINS